MTLLKRYIGCKLSSLLGEVLNQFRGVDRRLRIEVRACELVNMLVSVPVDVLMSEAMFFRLNKWTLVW